MNDFDQDGKLLGTDEEDSPIGMPGGYTAAARFVRGTLGSRSEVFRVLASYYVYKLEREIRRGKDGVNAVGLKIIIQSKYTKNPKTLKPFHNGFIMVLSPQSLSVLSTIQAPSISPKRSSMPSR